MFGDPMEIRPYQVEDEPDVVGLWRKIFGYGAPHNDPAFTIRQKLRKERELFFVSLEKGQIIGTVMCGYDGHRGWIYLLAVEPGHRGRGVGTALVRHAEAVLRKLGCPKINLQVLPDNSRVVEFYRKLGFNVEERISMGKVM